MNKMTIRDVDVQGKRVIVRVDFNVPIAKSGEITDDTRIKAALPTLKYLLDRDARIIIISHLGRPDGKVVDSLSMANEAKRLSQLIEKPVKMMPDCIGPEVEQAVSEMKNGDILFLENVRFHPEEESGDPVFAQSLARLGDIFVNDAFGTAHRAHASVSVIADYLPAVAGFLMEKEIEYLSNAIQNPQRPFAALIGGAKISDKVKMLENILTRVDYMLIGGGMAATFLKAEGYEVGKSLLESDKIKTASGLMNSAKKTGVRMLLPVDFISSDESTNNKIEMVQATAIPRNKRVVDIGPETINNFSKILKICKTVFWNGPMGIYEIPEFASGTQAIAGFIASLAATTIIGGGSTAEAVTELNLADKMSFVSTGGGASLSLVSGEKLPGVEALQDKK